MSGISAPCSRSGKPVPFLHLCGSRGDLLGLTLADVGAVIIHHLLTAWLLIGDLDGRQTDSISMGSALGMAHARMVVILFAVMCYSFQCLPSIAPVNHLSNLSIFGVDIVVLKLRYMDDVIGFWKACSCIDDALASSITRWLWERLLHAILCLWSAAPLVCLSAVFFNFVCLVELLCSTPPLQWSPFYEQGPLLWWCH